MKEVLVRTKDGEMYAKFMNEVANLFITKVIGGEIDVQDDHEGKNFGGDYKFIFGDIIIYLFKNSYFQIKE